MAKTLQFRRYTTANLASIVPASGELIVDTTQNTATIGDGTTYAGWYLTTQAQNNANVAIQNGINATQNTGITTASANTIYLSGVQTTQNANIAAAFTLANTRASLSGYTANSILFANATGYLSNTSNLQFISSNNALQTTGLIITTGNGIGYAAGAGGLVTQATSRTTGVTLNKPSGQITLFSQAMANTTANTFVFTNSTIGANDFIMFNHWSGGTIGNYVIASNTGVGIANVTIRAINTVVAEAPVLQYVVIKGAAS
jgi:hypothetical protein